MVESLSDMDLFEKNGEIFYPRFDLHTTRSFSKLPHEWQRALDGMRREHFYGHAQNELWRENGTQRLAMLIRASDMLLCAEDLGLIPDCVPEVLDSLQIACLKVQRMPRETWAEFDHPHTYPYLSVCCPSTHDMSTLRGWWEEDRGRTQRFYENVMGCSGASPQFAEPWVCRRVLSGMLHSNAMLAIFAIQDWMAVDGNLRRENPFVEQINVPANPKHVWKYRMHLRVDDLVGNEDFVNEVHSMVQESGRLQ
jgi:4-alpha-glucanotransferase